MSTPQTIPDEEAPLLQSNNASRKPTPLPKMQLFLLLLLRLAEPITSHSISPYINQLVSELSIIGGDKRKVGYYTGMLVSLHYAAEAITVLQWSRLSDHIGRKPVLLVGLLGTVVSTIMFGLSRSLWALVLSRCLNGLLNGNLGVIKSMIAELTDETNVARGFSLMPMSRAFGYIIGPFIGGVLSRPQDRWPDHFSHPFWAKYPYFLPCLVASVYAFISFLISAMYLEEVGVLGFPPGSGLMTSETSPKETGKPLPLRALLTIPVIVSVSNYAMLALLDMAAMALIPLVWATPVDLGGLNLSPKTIGLWLSGYGCLNGVLQFIFFPRVVGRLGPGRVVLISIASFVIIYTMFPFENMAARYATHGDGGGNLTVWLLVVLQLSFICVTDMGFNSIFMFLAAAAPNKRSLGATNGLAQTVVAVQRTVGPAVAASLFAFSLANNVMGGNFVYVVLVGFVCVGLCVARQLPRYTWNHVDRK
ncbi:MFS general substrate transporter [Multifurca ochricompacta]|uniref:MFS general substrate transporter n=1 Tax=Multifurca ochricompacta TaxID=376703 RepID=A0AAD4QLT6_9AGAM|nr:MFS general substrate transporter [Multifurca ochricompacta]